MSYTDSHCHLADASLASHTRAIIAEAQENDVQRFIIPTAQSSEFSAALALHQPPHIYAALGVHPWYLGADSEQALVNMEQALHAHPQLLIGEIGLDRLKNRLATLEAQEHLLLAQLALAKRYQRPVIIHNGKASQAIISSLHTSHHNTGGIVHGFSGSLEEAKSFIRQGFFIGIGSLILRENAKKARIAAQQLPLSSLVLETDSPFMSPANTPPNRPARIPAIAKAIAQLRQISAEEVAQASEHNINQMLNVLMDD